MKNLKFLVIFMAVLIVFGISFLIFAISTGMHKKGSVSVASSFEHTVTLTDNQMLIHSHIDQGRMFLHIYDRLGGNRHWKVIDYTTGQDVGKINIIEPSLSESLNTEHRTIIVDE